MKKSILVILLLAMSSLVFSQVIELKEVEITAVNYKYLSAVDSDETPISVKELEKKVAMYDIKSSEFYNDEYSTYNISFYIPDGKILAAYDKNGKLIRTIEKFKNVKLPKAVSSAIAERFPNWSMVSDVYQVVFHKSNDTAKKQYKVRLENGDKKMKVKLDEKGNFQ
ncbi:nicotinate-nucleotide adenylyltransferase [uncultured Winogradskyella sp.]|uniref:nicotinate-nucleotide adenylyltransferase n=1 Tax=uncultured Winogradskyella sp. TaxID=395353 RepID=UPI0026239E1D|nr:nicotinate-nucleotide adenylyltransferase [uncultured Winogradskyella sp.]